MSARILMASMAFCLPVNLVFVMTSLIPKPRAFPKPNLQASDLVYDSVEHWHSRFYVPPTDLTQFINGSLWHLEVGQKVRHHLGYVFYSCDKNTLTKSNLGRKGFSFCLQLSDSTPSLREVGNWSRHHEGIPLGGLLLTAYSVHPGLPAHRPILWRHFLSRGSLLPNESIMHQAGIKQTNPGQK